MKEIVNWRINLQVQGGPSLGDAQNIGVDAYEMLEVDIPAKANSTDGTRDIKLQLEDASKVLIILIKCSSTKGITIINQPPTPEGGQQPPAITVAMDGPLMLIGQGACQLLGNSLGSLVFSNSTDDPITVKILIGRDVT